MFLTHHCLIFMCPHSFNLRKVNLYEKMFFQFNHFIKIKSSSLASIFFVLRKMFLLSHIIIFLESIVFCEKIITKNFSQTQIIWNKAYKRLINFYLSASTSKYRIKYKLISNLQKFRYYNVLGYIKNIFLE